MYSASQVTKNSLSQILEGCSSPLEFASRIRPKHDRTSHSVVGSDIVWISHISIMVNSTKQREEYQTYQIFVYLQEATATPQQPRFLKQFNRHILIFVLRNRLKGFQQVFLSKYSTLPKKNKSVFCIQKGSQFYCFKVYTRMMFCPVTVLSVGLYRQPSSSPS